MDIDAILLNAILSKPRWQPLKGFVDRWYREPLGQSSLPVAQVVAVETKLKRTFPIVLKEWYVLVGQRFAFVNQDVPVRLSDQSVARGRLRLWEENQGVWLIDMAAKPTVEDVRVRVSGLKTKNKASVTEALAGMVVSDTLAGTLSGRGVGPLGDLKSGVVGGHINMDQSAYKRLSAALPSLDVWPNPFFKDPPRGHASLVIRWDGLTCFWMAASAEAEAEASALLELSDSKESHILVLSFSNLAGEGANAVRVLLDAALPHDSLQQTQARYSQDMTDVSIEFRTQTPTKAFEILKRRLPSQALDCLSAGVRPHHTVRFRPCWPPNAESFAMPR